LGYVLNAAVYAGFAFMNVPWQSWILFVFYGIYLGMSQGVLSAMVADTVPAERRGTAFGFINLAAGITLLPAGILGGLLWDKVSPSATFALGSFFSLIAAVLLFLTHHRVSPGK
jgi:MFS family permease